MKKILLLLTLSVIITSCDFEKVTTLEDDFEIKVAAEPIYSKINLKVFNSKNGTDIPSEVKVSFTGENADQIYTANGSKTFKIDNGFITIGVNRNFVITEDTPLNITASFIADGYMSKTREISFDGADITEVQVGLLKRDELPESIVVETANESLVGNKTTSAILVSSASSTDTNNTTEVEIPADTEFYDEDGNVMEGSEISVEVQTFDFEEPDIDALASETENPETLSGGLNEFPGTLEIDATTSAKSTGKESTLAGTGGYLIPISYQPCIYYYVNGRRVWRTSNATYIKSLISPYTRNPNTNEYIKVGDKIAVYQTVNGRNVKLKDVYAKRYPYYGGYYLYIEYTTPSPGIYPYGFEVIPECTPSTSISSIKFKNDGRRTFYFYSVSNKSNPYRSVRWGYMYFEGINEITSRNIWYWRNRGIGMLAEDMVLKIYGYSYDDRRYKVVYNEEVSKCELDGQTIDISNTDCYVERDMNLSLDCPDATYMLNNLYVYYRPVGGYWRYFDRISNSRLNGKSPCFNPGEKYEFGFWYGGWKTTPPLTEAEMIDIYKNFDLPAICDAIKDL